MATPSSMLTLEKLRHKVTLHKGDNVVCGWVDRWRGSEFAKPHVSRITPFATTPGYLLVELKPACFFVPPDPIRHQVASCFSCSFMTSVRVLVIRASHKSAVGRLEGGRSTASTFRGKVDKREGVAVVVVGGSTVGQRVRANEWGDKQTGGACWAWRLASPSPAWLEVGSPPEWLPTGWTERESRCDAARRGVAGATSTACRVRQPSRGRLSLMARARAEAKAEANTFEARQAGGRAALCVPEASEAEKHHTRRGSFEEEVWTE